MDKMIIVDFDSETSHKLFDCFKDSYSIIECINDNKAIDIIRRNNPDIVLYHIEALNSDFSLFNEYNEDDKNLYPIVVYSDSDDSTMIKNSFDFGASEYLHLPIENELVKRRIANLIKVNKKSIYESKDILTGIYTKENFFVYANKYIKKHFNEGLYLVSLDIQNFKQINALFGKKNCDDILISLASILQKHCKPGNYPYARFDNDSFGFITNKEMLEKNDFGKIYTHQINTSNINVKISLKFGLYYIDDLSVDITNMYEFSLMAIDSIKNNPKKHYSIFNNELLEKIKYEDLVTNDFYKAIANNSFVVYYQPVVALVSRKTVSCEALVRWVENDGSLIPPIKFIPILEKNGQIYELDMYVLDKVCQDASSSLKQDSKYFIPISVNLSRIDFYLDSLVDDVNNILRKYNLSHDRIRLEITESAFHDDYSKIVEVTKRFHDEGYTILMDDFGTGYSSLENLSSLPIDIVKMDMAFMNNIEINNKSSALVSSILRMCKLLDLKVIAEGVENNRQKDFLKSIGCEYAQGYLYARPLPKVELHKFLVDSIINNVEIKSIEERTLNLKTIWDTETRFSELFNKMVTTMGVYEYCEESGLSLVRVNNAYFRFMGGSLPSKYEDPNIPFKLDYEANKEIYHNALFESKRTNTYQIIKMNRTKYDGTNFVALITLKYFGSIGIRDEYIFSIKDITKEINLETENQMLLSNGSGFVTKYSFNIDTKMFNVLAIEGPVERITGYTKEEFRNKIASEDKYFLVKEDIEESKNAIINGITTGNTIVNTLRYIKKDGSIVRNKMTISNFTKHGSIVEFYTTQEDVDAEYRMRESNALLLKQYTMLLTGTNATLFDYDISADIVDVYKYNNGVKEDYQIKGYRNVILQNNGIFDPNVKPSYLDNFNKSISGIGNGSFISHFKYMNGNGNYFWALINYYTIGDEHNNPTRIYGRIDQIDRNYLMNENVNYFFDSFPGFIMRGKLDASLRNTTVIRIRGSIQRVLGYSDEFAKEKLENNANYFIYKDDIELGHNAFSKLIETKQIQTNILRFVKSDGSLVYLCMTINLIKEDSTGIEFFSYFMDVGDLSNILNKNNEK